jgi:hypothetical protein
MDEKAVRKLVKQCIQERFGNESDSSSDSDSDYVCICYGSGDSISLKKHKDDRELSRKNYDVIYQEHWNHFNILKKVIIYDRYFVNYLLEKSKKDFLDYDTLVHLIGEEEFLKKMDDDYRTHYLFTVNKEKDIPHSIIYLLIKNDISIDSLNHMFKLSCTPQQYFEYLDDSLFEKIFLFHEKGILINPFLRNKKSLLEDCEFLKKNVLHKMESVKQFVDICRLYKLKLPSNILKDYTVFDMYQINYRNTYNQDFHYHIKSDFCKHLKCFIDCEDLFEHGEEYNSLKDFFNVREDVPPMLLDFNMKQFFILEHQIVAGTYNTNSLLDFLRMLETYNIRICRESIEKDMKKLENGSFEIFGITYEKTSHTYNKLVKLMEYVV